MLIGYTTAALLRAAAGAVVLVMWTIPAVRQQAAAGGGGDGPNLGGVAVFAAGVGLILSALYPLCVLYFMTCPRVRAAFGAGGVAA